MVKFGTLLLMQRGVVGCLSGCCLSGLRLGSGWMRIGEERVGEQAGNRLEGQQPPESDTQAG